jgi:hypothetical protein
VFEKVDIEGIRGCRVSFVTGFACCRPQEADGFDHAADA